MYVYLYKILEPEYRDNMLKKYTTYKLEAH